MDEKEPVDTCFYAKFFYSGDLSSYGFQSFLYINTGYT